MGICASKQYSVPSLRYVATSPSSDPSFPLVGFARGTIVETSAHSGSSPHSNSLEVLHPFSGSAESAVRNDNLAPSQQPPMHGAHSAGSSAPAAEASFALQPGCKTAAAPDITSIPLLSPAISPELCPIARVEVLVRPPASPAAPQPHHADTNLPSLQPQQLSAESKPDSQAARRKATVKCDAAPLASQNLAQPVVAAPRERPKSRLAVSVSMRDLSELTPPTAQARTSPPSPVSQGPAAQPTQHTAQPAATLQPHCPELAAATATAAATLVVHEAASKLWPALPPTPAALPTPSIPAAKGGPAEPGLWVLRRTGDVRNKYIVGEQLGRGQFGVVCIAIDKAKGTRWALKSVSKRRVQGMHDFSMADVLREVEVLYTIGGHPGVVGLREVYEDAEDLHLIMELCQGGDWFEHLIKHGRYTEAEASVVVRSVLEALSYCHSLGIMHRDIKPENIMFEDRSDESAVKLTDFGLAGMFCEGGPRLTEVLGSAYYVAPEVLRESYSKEADIWSLGVVLFIALGGYAPFDGANEREVFTKILHEPLSFKDPSWEGISAEAKAVITSMLTKDPCRRATISELLSHEWLNTCAGTVSPTTCSPRDIFLPPAGSSKAEVVAAPLAARRNMVVCPSFVRRLPKGSIVAAVAAAAAKGKQVRAVPDAVVARLQHFSAMNVFKRQARLVLASLLPEEEVEGLMQVFISMDKDGDGVLSLRELRDALTQRGISTTDKTAKLLLERADLDGSGGVDYLEFLASTVHLARLERDERMWRAFRHFDTADTGFISRENLVQGLAHMGTKVDVDKILAEVDQDGDGKICYNEFCNMASVVDMEMSLECVSEGYMMAARGRCHGPG
ncbi:kinase-like domain-containing protein [Haematococcus lacustris]